MNSRNDTTAKHYLSNVSGDIKRDIYASVST